MPLSYLASDEKRGEEHPAHRKVPLRCSSTRGLEYLRSVAAVLSTAYCSGVRMFCHSASGWATSPTLLPPSWAACAAEVGMVVVVVAAMVAKSV